MEDKREIIRVVLCRTVLLVSATASLQHHGLVGKHTFDKYTSFTLPVILYVPHVLWPVVSCRVIHSL